MTAFRPHIASLFKSDISWCGKNINYRWMQGAEWREPSVDGVLMSVAHSESAKPCAACVAAVIKSLLILSPESMALTKREGETLTKAAQTVARLTEKAVKSDAAKPAKKPAPKSTTKKAAAVKKPAAKKVTKK